MGFLISNKTRKFLPPFEEERLRILGKHLSFYVKLLIYLSQKKKKKKKKERRDNKLFFLIFLIFIFMNPQIIHTNSQGEKRKEKREKRKGKKRKKGKKKPPHNGESQRQPHTTRVRRSFAKTPKKKKKKIKHKIKKYSLNPIQTEEEKPIGLPRHRSHSHPN